MNRKAEGVGNLIAITRARLKADLEALGSLGKSLETLTLNEYETMELPEWGHAEEEARGAQEDSIACLRILGALPPFTPRAGGLGITGVTKREAPQPSPATAGERKRVASGGGKPPADAATAHRARRPAITGGRRRPEDGEARMGPTPGEKS